MNNRPNAMARNGTYIICCLLLFFFTLSWVFKYPDIVSAKVIISSGNPPVKLVAKNSLPIQSIFIKNDDQVTKGQILCIFSNAARYEDVINIAKLVAFLDTTLDMSNTTQTISLPPNLQLGELQNNYVELYQALESYKFFLRHNAYDATISSFSNQVKYNEELQNEQGKKMALQQEQLNIQQRQFSADSSLVDQKIISRVEYEEAKRKVLDQQMNTGNNNTNTIQNKLQLSECMKNIAVATLQKQKDENDLLQKIKETVKSFQGKYAEWQQNYVLKSPVEGKISFFTIWKENQFVNAGEGIMMILPPTQDFIVRGKLGAERYGKIQPGQKVLLKLQAYPYEEYGMLEAQLTRKTIVSMDTNYVVEMKLKHGLTTNSGKVIPATPSLEATAEIVTENKSILERLFEKVVGK